MSRSRNSRRGSKNGHRGRDYWSPRLPGAPRWNASNKRLTHQKERAAAKREERAALDAYLAAPAGSGHPTEETRD